MELLQDNLLVELVHWQLHLGRQVEVQILLEVGVEVVGRFAVEHQSLGAHQEPEGVGVEEEEQMMGEAMPAGCPELVLDRMVVSHLSPKAKPVEQDEQWVGLRIAESSLAAPGTLFHVNHSAYAVPSVSAFLV